MKKPKNIPVFYSHKDIKRLLRLAPTKSVYDKRNKVIIDLVYATGLRASEVCNLNINNIQPARNFAIVKGKGNKQRIVIFGDITAKSMENYIKEIRPKLLKFPTPALFLNKKGNRLTRKGLWFAYNPIAKKAGLSTKLHAIRHTFATELLLGGADLRTIQELLGHENLETTTIYTHCDIRFLKKTHKKYLPVL